MILLHLLQRLFVAIILCSSPGSGFLRWEQRYDGMLECVQGKGDFLYIPEGFHHVVLNVWPSVGVAHEFVLPSQQEILEKEREEELAKGKKEL